MIFDSFEMFPTRLQNIREERKLTSKEAARKCHVHPSTWSSYETGKRMPSLDVFITICKKLNVSADTLLSLEIRGDDSSDANS